MDLERYNILRKKIFEELKDYDIENVIVFDAMKNNGITSEGLMIKRHSKLVVPCYLFDEADDPVEKADEIIDLYKRLFDSKSSLIVALENKELYKDKLENIPHRDFLDMVVVVKYALCEIDPRRTIFSNELFCDVTYGMLSTFGLTEDQLFKKAYDNTRELFGVRFGKISELFCENNDQFDNDVILDDVYYLTNEQVLFGANIMLYEDVLEEIYDTVGENFYIIPCDIDQLMIIGTDSVIDASFVSNSVNEINRKYFKDEKSLSESLLFYNHSKKTVGIVEI